MTNARFWGLLLILYATLPRARGSHAPYQLKHKRWTQMLWRLPSLPQTQSAFQTELSSSSAQPGEVMPPAELYTWENTSSAAHRPPEPQEQALAKGGLKLELPISSPTLSANSRFHLLQTTP